jgi:5-methylcytosine-specific restriction endonuclease McrA
MNTEKFKTYLGNCGAEVLTPTNPYELVRFRTENGVSVVYTGKRGETFTGESEQAYNLFKQNKKWKTVSRKRHALTDLKARLASRDGKECFFCGVRYKTLDRYTVEHLLSFSHGGKENINNLCLACESCNTAIGNMAIVKKVLFRDSKRGNNLNGVMNRVRNILK